MTTPPINPSTTPTTTLERSAFAVTIEVVTDIDAPAPTVWSIVSDVDRYVEWNPFITSLAGDLTVGSRLTAVLAPPGEQPRTFRPRVVEVVPGRSFTWLGRVGLPGVFDGRHHFEVQPLGGDRSRFVHRERLSGALVPFFRRMLTTTTPAGFEATNAALAARAAARG